MQTPPYLPPQVYVNAFMPLAGMAFVLLVTGFVALGPVGRAIGRVIMHRFGGEKDRALPGAEAGELRSLLLEQGERLEAVQRQVSELAERQDFAERLLAQARERKPLPGGGQP